MEEFEKLESLVDHSAAYARTRLDETRLELAEKSSGLMALLIERSIIGVVFLVGLLFVSTAGAIATGEYLGDEWKGFLVLGGFYFIIGCVLLAARRRLIRVPVMDTLIRYLFKNSGHEEN